MSSPFSLTLANPSRALSLIARLFWPMRFISMMTWPAALLAAIAGYFNWYDLIRNLDLVLVTFSFLQNLVISMLTANLFSRLAMGLTMAAYGIPPQEFGIRLFLGVIPRFFISTAPIRQLDFPDQRRCYAAPLLSRMGLFAVGVLGWVFLRRGGSGIADAALVLGATGFVSFLFTANPIWRSDGYHWVAAWFQMPDMREQSYRLLALILSRKPVPDMLSRRAIWGLLLYALASIIFTTILISLILWSVAYGLERRFHGAGVVLFALILSMMLAFLISHRTRKGGKANVKRARMVEASRSTAVTCYKQALAKTGKTVTGNPQDMARISAWKTRRNADGSFPESNADMHAILRGTPRRTEEGGEFPRPEGINPDLERALAAPSSPIPKDDLNKFLEAALGEAPARDGLPAPYSPKSLTPYDPKPSDELDSVLRIGWSRRTKASRLRTLLAWLVLLGGIGFVAVQPYPFAVGGDFIVQPAAGRTQVRSRTDGEIMELKVNEGDWVETNDVMAVLSNWDETRTIGVLEAELTRLKADLETLTAGPKQEEIALAEEEQKGAETKLAQAQRDLKRMQQLFESSVVPRKDLDNAQNTYNLAVVERDHAKAKMDLLKAPTIESQIASARAEIQRKEKELAYSRLQLEHTFIRAPISGQVISAMENVTLGTYMKEGDLIAELADQRTLTVEIEVPETEVVDAVLGAAVLLKPWSDPDAGITGQVKRISPLAEEREFGRVVRVIVEVPNPDGRLSRNMTGYGKIMVGDRPVWEVFTRIIVRFFKIEMWSWLP